MIIIVTGQICAGKSTYVKALHNEYAAQNTPAMILELDAIGHEVLPEIMGSDVDRKELGKYVFASLKRLQKLENAMHSRIMSLARARAEEFLEQHPEGIVLIESPLPLSASEYPWLEHAEVRVLQESYEERLNRALNRGMSAEQFELRDEIQRGYIYE